jgi:hypothetical protein
MGKCGPLAGDLPTKMYSRATTELLFRRFQGEVRRILLPGTSVNRPSSCLAFIVGSSWSATLRATKHRVR